jgi:hypothetical protein
MTIFGTHCKALVPRINHIPARSLAVPTPMTGTIGKLWIRSRRRKGVRAFRRSRIGRRVDGRVEIAGTR